MIHRILCLVAAGFASAIATVDAADPETDTAFNRDVRPILADKCFRCHGPDANARQADLRLDQREAATADRDGHRAITPGSPERSELVRRVMSRDRHAQMPPADSGLTLTSAEIETLRRWIAQGAVYERHWSFIAPQRPNAPLVRNRTWSGNAIDDFVLRKLERLGRQPSPVARTSTLIRRVTLDLTGLPPTLAEVDTFEQAIAKNPELAYEQLVDRLLASPRVGERMALDWLDAARYADTNGYFTDEERTMWPWRDWVINAFNQNMPFDRFTIEQLAGDLLPNPTIDQRIATGFNRNHTVNNETGIIEEEYRVEYVVDRVDTTSTVWLGLTVGCARCHDHKYDPIPQRDFYRFFAFFNNVPERGLSGSSGNSVPVLKVPAPELEASLARLAQELARLERDFQSTKAKLDVSQATWERTALSTLPREPANGLVTHLSMDANDESATVSGTVAHADGIVGRATSFGGSASVATERIPAFDSGDAFSFGAWVKPGSGCVLSKTEDQNDLRGFDLTLRKNKAIVNLVHRWNSNAIQIETENRVSSGQWQHLFVTYDGSRRASGVALYLDGKRQNVYASQDTLTESLRNDEPLRVGRRKASASFKGLIDDVRVYDRVLTEEEVAQLVSRQLVASVLSKPAVDRSDFEKKSLRRWYVDNMADATLAETTARIQQLRDSRSALSRQLPTTMVMQDSEEPRRAFILNRGQYDQQGEPVSAGVPVFLAAGSAEDKSGSSRLELARWLVEPSHPLTARVTVNRLWQQFFGVGLVKTVDDFGTQGEWPSHPELLDWLALELIDSDWDLKHIVRQIVTSATYRQSSAARPAEFQRDRDNRQLARGPRFRMSAEMLRDNALAISGLLVERLGGPSVRPYQPDGLWKQVTYDSNRHYEASGGASLYRRSLYTFWKRQAPPPNMLVFDAPTRETCTVQRSRTNTPLQALALMNDPTFVEAARRLAERAMTESDQDDDRVVFLFRTALARKPASAEAAVVLDVLRDQLDEFRKAPEEAQRLLSVGESTYDKSLKTTELAAWATVTNMILSLDESITRP